MVLIPTCDISCDLRDSVPSARQDWLPPDPFQAEFSRDVDVVMDLSV